MIHSKNDLVTSINGKIAEFDNLDLQTTISEGEAQQFAKTALKVKSLSKEYPIEKLIYWNKGEEKAEETPKLKINFKKGDRVKINEGTFENFEGEVEQIDEANGRVTVMLSIFGRSTPVDIESEDKPTGISDGPMAAYAQAISRTLSK